jgi:hypothetical protein
VLGTNVGSKLFVTLSFVLPLHFIERFANDRNRRIEHPVALRATEALKVLFLNPYELAHVRIISLAMCNSEQGLEAATC